MSVCLGVKKSGGFPEVPVIWLSLSLSIGSFSSSLASLSGGVLFGYVVEGGFSSEEEVSYLRGPTKRDNLSQCALQFYRCCREVVQKQSDQSDQSEAKWPVCSQLKQITVWQALV